MIRTQIYLSEEERSALRAMAEQTGKTTSEVIRQAIDRLIEESKEQDRRSLMRAGKGLWKGRKDLPSFTVIRKEFDRMATKE